MLEVVCALIEHKDWKSPEGQALLLATRHGRFKQSPGLWEFPGGKREQGESLETALRREIQEELGVSIDVGPALTPIPKADFILHPFRCQILKGIPGSQEHDCLFWGSPANLLSLCWLSADFAILKEWLHVAI